MNPHLTPVYRAGIFLLALVLIISCKKEESSPEPEYEPVLAPGVHSLTFVNGVVYANVDVGDIVAVFSTDSETENTFMYTIQGSFPKSTNTTDRQGINSLGLPGKLLYNRRNTRSLQSGINFAHQPGQKAGIGDTETFWTWDLGDISNYPDIPSVQFTAVLKAEGLYCDVYVDEDINLISVVDAVEIARQFDEVAFPVVTAHFGQPPLVKGSSRIAILLPLAFNGGIEDEVNPNGWAAGAFNDLDQLPPSAENPYSNYRNVLYLNPGLYNSNIPVFINKWRSILSHEFQHMVNYRYHGMNEAVPIDEGKALLAEILSGYGLPYGDYLMWTNVVAYQNNPTDVSLLQLSLSEPNPLGSYGMGLLWVCYLYDRFGSKAIYDMAVHPLPGLDGAEAVTGIPKQHLFVEWLQANILSGKVNNKIFEYKTIDVVGDGGGQFFGMLNGFAALPEHSIPGIESQRHVHSYGLEYYRADLPGEVTIKGSNIKAFIISKQ